MPHPANIQSNLESQFDKIDNMYLNDDLRVFGRDTDRIFKQVDIIRRKQIELATEHIGLDNMEDSSLPVSDDIDDEYKRNLLYFSKKEMALKSLMGKLDTLGEIMQEQISRNK
ncbi:hypothetical protein BDF21DRAFT_399731 [Thamnidium elegans]|nr:hypothetical protein BDF21DRAFT_399731 [Thamnidium elegans]